MNKSQRGFGKEKKNPVKLQSKAVKSWDKAWWVPHPLQDLELSVLSPDIKNRIIWDGFPPQDPLDCLTSALHPLKLLNQLTQACLAN